MTKRYLKTPEEVIDALQAGKEVRDNESVWTLYKSCIVRKDKDGFWSMNPEINADFDGVYVDEPEPLKLEVGKFYRTRDDRKAWIVEGKDINGAFPFTVTKQKECISIM